MHKFEWGRKGEMMGGWRGVEVGQKQWRGQGIIEEGDMEGVLGKEEV